MGVLTLFCGAMMAFIMDSASRLCETGRRLQALERGSRATVAVVNTRVGIPSGAAVRNLLTGKSKEALKTIPP